jgi:hypothetical protein
MDSHRPALSAYLRSLDARGARRRRRASARLAEAHRDHQHEIALLLQRRAWAADDADRVAIARISDCARAARRTYSELAEAERRRRVTERHREIALRYAAASRDLDAVVEETAAARLTR